MAFNAVPASATIPANGTLVLRLTGTPEEVGTLVIRGCTIKIIGFAEQEFLVDYGSKTKETAGRERNKSEQGKNDFMKMKQR